MYFFGFFLLNYLLMSLINFIYIKDVTYGLCFPLYKAWSWFDCYKSFAKLVGHYSQYKHTKLYRKWKLSHASKSIFHSVTKRGGACWHQSSLAIFLTVMVWCRFTLQFVTFDVERLGQIWDLDVMFGLTYSISSIFCTHFRLC